jgi:hypothetical protein
MVVPVISFRDGQETFFISSRTSVKNDFKRVHREVTYSVAAVVTFPPIRRRTAPLRGPSYMTLAGLEGLEPPTLGFGDRCSTN